MKLCPHCHRRMPLKKLTTAQLAQIKEFYNYIIQEPGVAYASNILVEFKAHYPSFKGSQKLILKHLCQLGCRLDSVRVNNKTVAVLHIK